MIIDIRDSVEEEVEGIAFDGSGDYIFVASGSFMLYSSLDSRETTLCDIGDVDNLIKALQKAKELWG